MDSIPLVSVIIPTKNVERTIKTCLESIKNQSYTNIELIIIDNHSKDNSLEIAAKYTDKIFIKGPERSAQKNYGVTKAKGEFICMLDSDLYAHPDTIKECVARMISGEYRALIIPEKSIGQGYWTKVKAFERSFYVGNKYMEATRFYDKQIYKKIGGFDESLIGGEDWDLTIRIRKSGYKIGRALSLLEHDEGTLTLFGSSKKKRYYGHDVFSKYAIKHPEYHKKQMNPFVRFPVHKLISKGLTHPFLLLSLVIMKSLELYYGMNKIGSAFNYEK